MSFRPRMETLAELLRTAVEVGLDTGTVTSATSTTLEDSSKKWGVDQWVEAYVEITDGKGKGQIRKIISNTETELTISSPWSVVPDTTSKYRIFGAPSEVRLLDQIKSIESTSQQEIRTFRLDTSAKLQELIEIGLTTKQEIRTFRLDTSSKLQNLIGIESTSLAEIRDFKTGVVSKLDISLSSHAGMIMGAENKTLSDVCDAIERTAADPYPDLPLRTYYLVGELGLRDTATPPDVVEKLGPGQNVAKRYKLSYISRTSIVKVFSVFEMFRSVNIESGVSVSYTLQYTRDNASFTTLATLPQRSAFPTDWVIYNCTVFTSSIVPADVWLVVEKRMITQSDLAGTFCEYKEGLKQIAGIHIEEL